MASTLLLVDDEPSITNALQRVLRPEGYHVLTANSGSQALDMLRSQSVDVVISDYRMPDMSGPALLQQVATEHPQASRLMLSGEADLHAVIEAMNAGTIEQFLTKPWSSQNIRSTVRQTVEQQRHTRNERDTDSNALTRHGLLGAVCASQNWTHLVGLSITNPTTFNLLNSDETSAFIEHLSHSIAQTTSAASDFGVLGPGAFACAVTSDNIEETAKGLAASLGAPIRLGSSRLFIRVHIATTAADPAQPAESLRELLITLNALESEPAGSWRSYRSDLRANLHYRYTLEQDLFHALRRNELFFQIQPQHRASNGRVFGGELLSRWRHRTHGLIAPLEFIDMAERTGIIREIGEWVLSSGVAMAKLVEELGARISVNISPRQFALHDLAATVARMLDATQINPAALELEITESSVMQNLDDALRTLRTLKSLGVRLAIDDFGTGHSSLSQLHQLELDTIKFDRSFIAGLQSEPMSVTLLSHVVGLARDLGLETVAEGVETYEQYQVCRELGLDLIQGFYFNRPMSADDFVAVATRGAAH